MSGATLSRDRYARFLRGSLSTLAHLEPALRAFDVLVEGEGTRCEALEADLDLLGVSEHDEVLSGPAIDTTARAMGAAYVIEGSSLGGAVIARSVAPMLEREGAPSALRYLRFHPRPQVAWRAFLDRLAVWEAHASDADKDAACDSARATFAAYADAFQQTGLTRAST